MNKIFSAAISICGFPFTVATPAPTTRRPSFSIHWHFFFFLSWHQRRRRRQRHCVDRTWDVRSYLFPPPPSFLRIPFFVHDPKLQVEQFGRITFWDSIQTFFFEKWGQMTICLSLWCDTKKKCTKLCNMCKMATLWNDSLLTDRRLCSNLHDWTVFLSIAHIRSKF